MMEELYQIRSFARKYWAELVIASVATISLILFRYHSLGSIIPRHLVFSIALPVAALLIARRNPLAMGLGLGDRRAGALHLLIGGVAAIAVVAIGSRLGSVSAFYAPKADAGTLRYIGERAVVIFAVEYFFRGFLLFGLKEKLGRAAILVQMIPFALMHIGKPEIEALGCVVTGLYFGYVAYRARSLWPVFGIHLIANAANILFVTS